MKYFMKFLSVVTNSMLPLFGLLFLAIGCGLTGDLEDNGVNSSVKAETVTPSTPPSQELPANSFDNIYAAISTRVGAPMPEAAIRGQFVISNRCLTFQFGEDSSNIYTAILPAGSEFIGHGSTVTKFQVGNKSVVLGQLYEIGGGQINPEGIPYYKLEGSIDSSCPSRYLGVGEIMSQEK
jgi:hypothetical protein